MTQPVILVTGANGTVGSETVSQLIEGGYRVRALVRNTAKAAHFSPKVEIVVGDLARPESLAAAFGGVEKAVVISTGPDLSTLEGNAYDAAKRAGVRHVVKLSGRHLDADWMLAMPLAQWHRDSEQRLRSSGMSWTIVRPGSFASNFLMWFDPKQAGVFLPLGDGKDSFIDPRDIAAVIVAALTRPGHDGAIYEITSQEWLDLDEATGKISAAIGKPVTYTDIPEVVMLDGLKAGGVPADYAHSMLCYFKAIRDGRNFAPTSAVAELVGRAPYTLDDWARHNASRFQAIPS